MKQAVTGDKDYQIGDSPSAPFSSLLARTNTSLEILQRVFCRYKNYRKASSSQSSWTISSPEGTSRVGHAAMATEDSESGSSNNADELELTSRVTRRQLEEWDTAFGASKGGTSNTDIWLGPSCAFESVKGHHRCYNVILILSSTLIDCVRFNSPTYRV